MDTGASAWYDTQLAAINQGLYVNESKLLGNARKVQGTQKH